VAIPAVLVAKIGDPAYQPAMVPANTYKGQAADVATVAINNFLVTHQGLGDDAVYAMTKAIFDNLTDLQAAHAAAKDIKLENAAKAMPVPLHPGAERFYREKGLVK